LRLPGFFLRCVVPGEQAVTTLGAVWRLERTAVRLSTSQYADGGLHRGAAQGPGGSAGPAGLEEVRLGDYAGHVGEEDRRPASRLKR